MNTIITENQTQSTPSNSAIPTLVIKDKVLIIPDLKTKFDLSVVSNSLVKALGDYLEARVLQQFYYLSVIDGGFWYKGRHWIYKKLSELIEESFIGFSEWQVRQAIARLIEKGLLLKEYLWEQQFGRDGSKWLRNRTLYYAVNVETSNDYSLESSKKVETALKQGFENITNPIPDKIVEPFCVLSQNNTEQTSIENNQRSENLSPTPQSNQAEEREAIATKSKQNDRTNEPIDKEIDKVAVVNESASLLDLNKLSTTADKPVLKKSSADVVYNTPSQLQIEISPPWRSQDEKRQFHQALIAAFKAGLDNSRSPLGLAKTVLTEAEANGYHVYWDDFEAGDPIGTSTKPDWYKEPGVPNSYFIEYLAEKLKGGHDSPEKAREAAFKVVNDPQQAKIHWAGFKATLVSVNKRVIKQQESGVAHPDTPNWTKKRPEPNEEELYEASLNIAIVNHQETESLAQHRCLAKSKQNTRQLESTLPEEMPVELENHLNPVPTEFVEETEQTRAKLIAEAVAVKSMPKPDNTGFTKTTPRLSHMTLDEINERLQEPVLSQNIRPWLEKQVKSGAMECDRDEYGRIIVVRDVEDLWQIT